MFAVVLEAGDIGAEEGCKLSPASCALALVAHLVIENVRLNLNLQSDKSVRLVSVGVTRQQSIGSSFRHATSTAHAIQQSIVTQPNGIRQNDRIALKHAQFKMDDTIDYTCILEVIMINSPSWWT